MLNISLFFDHLRHAILSDLDRVALLLIQNKADLNAVDNKGKTALLYAMELRMNDVEAELIKKGAPR